MFRSEKFMKKLFPFLLLLSLTALRSDAQQAPAKPQSRPVILSGGTAHLGNGLVIYNAVVVFENGKITAVGDASVVRVDKTNAEVYDITGKHVYPGLIAPNTRLGLEEIEAVRATRDYAEVGGINPNLRSIIAYNTDSRITPTVRSNGILLAEIVPQGGLIPGTSSVAELDGWNWEDAAYKTDIGIHLNWPRMNVINASFMPKPEEQKEKVTKELRQLSQFFAEAKAYAVLEKPEVINLKLEAMRGLFDGTKKLFIHANQAKEIMTSVKFAKENEVKEVVIVGGKDAHLVTDVLKENSVSVILEAPHSLPGRQEDDIDLSYKTAKLLQDEGVFFCISIDGSWQTRNLPFMAGTACTYGLSKEQALAAITLNTAKILGIDQTCGSIEEGKDATLFVSKGDALDMMSNDVELAFIRGKKIDLDNKQKALYRKYKEKYNLK